MSEMIGFHALIIAVLGWIIYRVERVDRCLRQHLVNRKDR